MSFKSDDEVLKQSLIIFKEDFRFLIQDVERSDLGVFVFGNQHEFKNQGELRSWICGLPGNKMYISVVIEKNLVQVGYRGYSFAALYNEVNLSPKVSYFRSFKKSTKAA